MAFKLLSCDGGGVRGYLTCLILSELHKETGFLHKVDGFIGTSTGGLLAVALADGRSQGKDLAVLMDEITSIYRNQADKIFRENEHNMFDRSFDALIHKFGFGDGPGIRSSQFTSTGLAEIGKSLVGDRELGSISPEIVLAVPAVCLHWSNRVGWAPFTLTNQELVRDDWLNLSTVKLLDMAMATSAAPTFFPPHQIVSEGRDYGYFIDGGVFANNPVLNGINVAIAAGKAKNLSDIEVISIGTGRQPISISEEMVKNPDDWGLLKWFGLTSGAPGGALLDLGLTTSAENQYWIAKLVLDERLVRLDPPLSKTVSLTSRDAKSYEQMKEASQFAMDSPYWQDALVLLQNW
ncbi:patatin-like phospholipase family protein [Falsiruegeria mediterranea]|jgi:patatin-like phospholipase/acyl hydrolase|uniref:Sporulation hydrolase CotR n=1 Tax=Falsiruegeria mediterranea M17 TaxID=1200281 RepID=A0A2R8CGF9_9RHOB|nr:patatin-like phospholipase family protein [Falsiruegeria mediterranea]SPJ31487.1 Putative sporulation hydrolase CotR [Falsiruegeria mediterranea M17]